jgi:AcrR family transcriptional regulator
MKPTTSQTGDADEGRRERNKRDKQARILAAARELFEEHGFEETTGRQISERAGIATGTLFLYVRDKVELLLWVFEAEAERILSRRRATRGNAVERWMAVFGPFLTFYARNPRLSASYVKELLFIPDRPPELDRLNRALREAVRDVTRDAQASGELRPDVDLDEIVQIVVGQYAHLVQLWLGVGAVGARQVRTRLRRGLSLLIEGIGS